MVEEISFKLGLVGELLPNDFSLGGHLRWKSEGSDFRGEVCYIGWWQSFYTFSEETIFLNDAGEEIGRSPGSPWLAAVIEVDVVQPKPLAVTRGPFEAVDEGTSNVRSNIHGVLLDSCGGKQK